MNNVLKINFKCIYVDNSALMADLKADVSNLLANTMKGLKEDIAIHVSNEIRAAISVQNDRTMELLGAIPAVKSTSEFCITKLDDIYDYLGEIAESVNNISVEDPSGKLEAVSKDIIKANQEAVAQTRSQLSSISALLTESLKVSRVTLNIFGFFLGFI